MSEQTEVRALLAETAQRLFTGHVDAKLLDAAKTTGWSDKLWHELEQAELPLVGVPEEAGGAGGSLSDAAAVLRIAARHAAPVPLAETMLAGWLLSNVGLKASRGALTVASHAGDAVKAVKEGATWRLTGKLPRVPYARGARHLVLLTAGQVFSVEHGHFRVTPGRNLAGEARDDVTLNHAVARAAAPTHITHAQIYARGALLRAVQIGGALERALELACEYAKTRVQFGRPIAQFQAIQQELARCGGEVAAAVAASLSAAGVAERQAAGNGALAEMQQLMAVASAKVRTADAAREATAIAHQVHGAIGVTDEYALHHYTLRALAWREEFGNEVFWSQQLGRAMLEAGADLCWPLISAA
jgi:acyl-CoA dehydrogenase